MAKNTPRDQIWIHVIRTTVNERLSVTSTSVAEEVGVSERTARDALKSMPFLKEKHLSNGRVKYTLEKEDYFKPVDGAAGLDYSEL